ncbi:MAG TPA: hypothetical protein VGD66_15170 [Allosphingosinicella sp.]|jgi:hypothetical protein
MGQDDSERKRHYRIDDAAKGVFLETLHEGAWLKDAARRAGFTLGAFWKERRRDPAFDAAVVDALDLTSDACLIRPTNGRPLQRRGHRRLRFVGWRVDVFLAHFASTCNETEAAEAAGVAAATVYRKRRKDPAFAAAHQAALDHGYVRLEAEALRQRLAAQQRMAEAVAAGTELGAGLCTEFERVMTLLARWDRRGGQAAPRTVAPAAASAWTFDSAIDAIERKLRALGIPVRALPAEPGDEGEVE